jgi:hypothetical protein
MSGRAAIVMMMNHAATQATEPLLGVLTNDP